MAQVLPDWARLLDARDQPTSVREAYELVAQLVVALGYPCPLDPRELYPAAAARAGYLIAAVRRVTTGPVHETWEMLQEELRLRLHPARDVELLVSEPGSDPYDELATVWGLRRGLDADKLRRIVRDGWS